MRRFVLPILALSLAILACNISLTTSTPAVTEPLFVTGSPPTATITVYFTDMARYQIGTEPYETAVTRTVPAAASRPEAVLTQLFLGPTDAEKASGLEVILSGTTGFNDFTVENGVARVYLTGTCNSNGSTYTIANLISANLTQFPQIHWIKIYDENGQTEVPGGQSGSIPVCLEP